MNGSVDLSIHNAAERLTYAALLGDDGAMKDALADLARPVRVTDEPSAEVREAVIAADPVSAAAVGWISFSDLVNRVQEAPAQVLEEVELDAFKRHGQHVLRLIVANRTVGAPLEELLEAQQTDIDRSAFALAARGDVSNPDAVVAVLREHGLLHDEDIDAE